jgi:hypothetical protein
LLNPLRDLLKTTVLAERVLRGGALRFPEFLIDGSALRTLEGVHKPIVPAKF